MLRTTGTMASGCSSALALLLFAIVSSVSSLENSNNIVLNTYNSINAHGQYQPRQALPGYVYPHSANSCNCPHYHPYCLRNGEVSGCFKFNSCNRVCIYGNPSQECFFQGWYTTCGLRFGYKRCPRYCSYNKWEGCKCPAIDGKRCKNYGEECYFDYGKCSCPFNMVLDANVPPKPSPNAQVLPW